MQIPAAGLAAALVTALAACHGPPPAPLVTHGFVEVDGGRLYFEERGTGRAVVLIHGGGLDRRMWDPQFDLLAEEFRVLRHDVRGYGRSVGTAAPYCSHEDLHAVTMALQLAGHALDDGRRVTLFMNVRAPKLARKDLPETVKFQDNPPTVEMIADLLARGADLVVCPHCMKAQNITAEQLHAKAQVANRELLFGRLGANTTVFSY